MKNKFCNWDMKGSRAGKVSKKEYEVSPWGSSFLGGQLLN